MPLKKLASDKLLKVTFYNAIATVIRMLSSLATNKIMAVLIGAEGFVLIGQISNLYAVVITFVTALGVALTKYVAQYKLSHAKTRTYLDTVFTISLLYSLVVTLALLLFAAPLSAWFLKTTDYASIIMALGATFIGSALNSFYLATINGFQQHRTFVVINILNSVLTLGFTVALMMYWSVYGALLANVTYQAVCFVLTYLMVRRKGELRLVSFRLRIDRFALRKVLLFSVMPIFSGLAFPLAQLVSRDWIITAVDMDSAGYWEAINRISNMEILVITTSLSVYFLPRLSELKKSSEVEYEIFNALKKIIPPLILITVAVILLRGLVTNILFAPSFAPMNDLYVWQFTGNIFKVAGWIIAYRMLAKSMIFDYLLTECIYYAVYLVSTYVLLQFYGLHGATMGYLVSYFIYFIYLFVRFRVYRSFLPQHER